MTTTPNPTPANNTEPFFQIQRVYLKDQSLEQPNSPAILLEKEPPTIDINIAVDTNGIVEHIYEVSLTATVHAKLQDRTVFLIEVKQAGIFEIRNIPQDQMGGVLSVACPQIIYPYLRSNVADTITRAGFAPVHLTEINFHAMYEAQLAQQSQSNEAAANGDASAIITSATVQ